MASCYLLDGRCAGAQFTVIQRPPNWLLPVVIVMIVVFVTAATYCKYELIFIFIEANGGSLFFFIFFFFLFCYNLLRSNSELQTPAESTNLFVFIVVGQQ